MPPFSLLFTIIVIFIFIKKDTLHKKYINLVSVEIILEMTYFQGYYLKYFWGEDGGKSCSVICSYILLIFSIYILFVQRKKMPERLFLAGGTYLIIVILGIVVQYMFPYDGLILPKNSTWDEYVGGDVGLIKYSFSIENYIVPLWGTIRWLFIVLAFKVICTKDDLIYVLGKVYWFSLAIVCWGIFEFVLKNIIHFENLPYDMVKFFFGEVDQTVDYVLERNDLVSLQGATREPSHFVLSLLNLFFVRLVIYRYNSLKNNLNIGRELLYFILVFILMYFSQGFTSIWCISIALIMWYLSGVQHNNTIKSYIKGGFKLLLIVALGWWLVSILVESDNYYGIRLGAAISILDSLMNGEGVSVLGTTGGMSTFSRLTSVFVCFRIFWDNCIWGLGIGAQTAHAITATLLSNIGIVGMISWIVLLNTNGLVKRKYDLKTFLFYLIIGGLVTGMGNSPLYRLFFVFLLEATSLYYEEIK
ncbi:hypothetical protein SAMN02910356_01088 [Selenomonas sp. GACV-9]|uniref:hypothetical protein n=1 Tax=Selenomonas sp. GACV-9 TaxID=3158782 RepID=UPI0008EE3CA2|nr:hypothetical protein SAMN02910356_01088 [Selenomonas ruminantium]